MSEHGATAQVSLTRRRAVGLAAAMGISAVTAALAAQASVVLADGASDAATLTDLPLVEFGSYPQGPAAEVLPIEWYVLAEEEGRQLLLSKYALDCHAYNTAFEGVTWQVCDLRFWLNGEFALAAFANAQRTRIARSELVNKDNDEYGTRGEEVTRDHVFCLSLDEVARYLATDANTHSHVGIAQNALIHPTTKIAGQMAFPTTLRTT